MKDKGFARAVNRDDIVHGAAGLGVEVDALIADVIVALSARAPELGIAGVAV
jgi:predicted hydrolase (HD superfamily)